MAPAASISFARTSATPWLTLWRAGRSGHRIRSATRLFNFVQGDSIGLYQRHVTPPPTAPWSIREKARAFAAGNDAGLMIRAGPRSKPRGTVLVGGGAHRGLVDGAGGGLGELMAHPSTRQGQLLRRGTSRRRRCSPLMGSPLSANTNDRF